MSLLLQSLAALETAGSVQNNQRLTLITAGGLVNVNWGTLSNAVSAPLDARLTALEGGAGAAKPSIWPTARTISLTGIVTGSVALDGSGDVSLATSIANGALTTAKTAGLQSTLDNLTTGLGNRWGTGVTEGPNPSIYTGDLNLLAGATFVRATNPATNLPTVGGPNFTVLTNGLINYGNQLAFGADTLSFRTQNAGTWGSWRNLWHSGNLDPSNLLLKTDTATAASKLATARSFSLTGAVTASAVQFDGSQNVTLNTSITDGSIAIASVSGLTSALALKAEQYGLIPAGRPLNSNGNTGFYGQTVAAQATLANNYPVAGALGVLNVTQQTGYIEQEYITTSNAHYRRFFNGSSWSGWARLWSSDDFDPTSKYDKTGGVINGNVTVTGTVASNNTITGTTFISTVAPTVTPLWLLSGAGYTGRTRGIQMNEDYVMLVNNETSGTANYNLRLSNAGLLELRTPTNTLSVWHAGNFTPDSPVDSSGQIRIGPSDADSVRFRKDGYFSVAGGAWKALGAGDSTADPIFNTISFGTASGAMLGTSESNTGIGVAVGAPGARKSFSFGSNGDFTVGSGRLIVGSNVVWHAGNFDPSTKLGTTATAAAATKLATARTINGVAFDGTANITVPSNVNPDDFVKVIQTAATYTNADSLNGKLAYAVSGGTALGVPEAYMTTWNFGDNGSRDGQFAWTYSATNRLYFRSRLDTGSSWKPWYQVWTAASFNPNTKADIQDPVFKGTAYFDVDNGSTAKGRFIAGASNGINLDAVNDDASQFAPLNLRGTAVTINGNTPWTNANFDPNSKLNARDELGAVARTHSDWNTATTNGWWMAANATNAPVGNWLLGIVTQHNNDWIQQEVYDFTGGISGPKWYRWKLGGTWSAWTQDFNVGGALYAGRIWTGWDSGIGGSISCSNWFRSQGQTGIYFADYGGGWNMTDTTYVRAYNGKQCAAGDFVISSDVRLKTAINPLEFRGRLRPVHFTMRKDGRRDMGFIADEVEKLYPEAVGEIECVEDGPLKGKMIKQLSQQKLVAVVSHQVNAVEDDVIALRAELAALRQEIAELKNNR
jgi:hypothetical protein